MDHIPVDGEASEQGARCGHDTVLDLGQLSVLLGGDPRGGPSDSCGGDDGDDCGETVSHVPRLGLLLLQDHVRGRIAGGLSGLLAVVLLADREVVVVLLLLGLVLDVCRDVEDVPEYERRDRGCYESCDFGFHCFTSYQIAAIQ